MAAKKKSKKATPSGKKTAIKLIQSKDKNPVVKVKAGMRFEVTSVSVVTPELRKPDKIAARLCGGTSTCLALIELD